MRLIRMKRQFKTIKRSLRYIGVLLFFLSSSLFAQQTASRNLLSGSYSREALDDIVIPQAKWHPYPTAEERGAWDSLPPAIRQAHLQKGEQALGYNWPVITATLLLEYARNGDRSRHSQIYKERREKLGQLAIAECMEGKGRFVDEIANGIWAICEESSWVIPAHLDKLQKAGKDLPDVAEPTVDLFGAETASLLAWVIYLHGPALDKVSPLVRERVQFEMGKRILTPNLERNDFWWMDAAMNWNTWICSNWLTATLLIERDETKRIAAVHKIMRTLDNFLNAYPADGGCDEGPGYWGHAAGSLFDCLELFYSATNGKINIYKQPLIQNMAKYIYRVQISDHYFINFADAAPKQRLPANLIFRFGERINDPKMTAFGAFLAKEQGLGKGAVGGNIGHQLATFFNIHTLLPAKGQVPLLQDTWLPDIEVMAARSKPGSSEGLYIAAKGGHNNESHNHNDVGSFIIYVDGQPAIIDVGVENYTAKTFGPQRYEIWTMQSAYHNLPIINGVMQQNGREFAAKNVTYRQDKASAMLSMNIAGAYPANAEVSSWHRTLRLNRGKNVEVTESYAFKKAPSEITLALMTPFKAVLSKPGVLTLNSNARAVTGSKPLKLFIHYDPEKLKPVMEEIELEDSKLQENWGSHLTRILFKAENPLMKDSLKMRFEQ